MMQTLDRRRTVTMVLTESGATSSSETPPAAADQLGGQLAADLRSRGGVSGPLPAGEGRDALCAAFDRWLLVPTLQALAGESFLPVESKSDCSRTVCRPGSFKL